MPRTPAPSQLSRAAPQRRKLRIALRLLVWSEWARQVFRGVQGYAHSMPDWQLQVVTGTDDSVANMGNIQWDGVITHVLGNIPAIRRLRRGGQVKIVSFTAAHPKALLSIPSVRVDDSAIAQAIGQHFLSGGFRRFAYYRTATRTPIQDYRAQALMEFAGSVNCPCEMAPYRSSTTTTSSVKELKRWIARLQKPVGIFAWSMGDAVRIVQACVELGVPVPEQAAIVSWDDDSLLSESVSLTVSGAVLPAEKLGREAAKLLDRLLRGGGLPHEPVLVQPSGVIHIRQSSDVSTIADRDVHLATRYIVEHASQPLAVKQLIAELHVSRSKLERDFRRVTGQTLNEAIVAAHMERARQLLVETDWPIDRVAKYAGFGTKRHFHRIFFRMQKTTPDQYRRRFAPV